MITKTPNIINGNGADQQEEEEEESKVHLTCCILPDKKAFSTAWLNNTRKQ